MNTEDMLERAAKADLSERYLKGELTWWEYRIEFERSISSAQGEPHG